MRGMQTAITALLAAGLSSVAYAGQPAGDAAQPAAPLVASSMAVSSAVQEPKERPEARPHQEGMPAHKAQSSKAEAKQNKQEMKADKKQDKKQAKADKKADKNGGGEHGKIKEKDYKAHFGKAHQVSAHRVIKTTHIVPNQTRFTYVGYTFMFVQPWPMGWGFDDDVYIDYVDGGYYMFDVMHPGMMVGLTIVM